MLSMILIAAAAAGEPDDGGVIIHLGGEVRAADDAGKAPFAALPNHRVTIDVVEADVGALLRLMATNGDLNIVLADGVAGTVTVQVEAQPWDLTLDHILQAAGLEATQLGDNVLLVSPAG
ncbi:MAG: secretin and TonB N-terminal domain-containing protein [Alphaproteobacteria bacterium]|nr:secretin and TonB N-terminal domain-containing protein [Alphaproteobacteria bacterium]